MNFGLKMKGLGKLDAGNPHLQFDEGSAMDGHWQCLSARQLGLLYYTTIIELAEPLARRRGSALDRWAKKKSRTH